MTRSPTETVMAAMETFGEIEPKECIIIWTDESGDICWSSTTDSQVVRLGMIELLKTILTKRVEV
jgi:hypothetical protein